MIYFLCGFFILYVFTSIFFIRLLRRLNKSLLKRIDTSDQCGVNISEVLLQSTKINNKVFEDYRKYKIENTETLVTIINILTAHLKQHSGEVNANKEVATLEKKKNKSN